MIQIKHIFILLPLLLLCGTKAIADELPDLGEPSEMLLSPQMEKRLGREFMKEVRHHMLIVDDIIIDDYIQHLGERLASHANTKRKEFHFFVVNDPTFNAFAGPDAYIGINSGTLIATRTESELAAVMAHEIAHITQHHIQHLIGALKNTQIAAAAGILAAIIIGLTNSDNKSKTNIDSSTTASSSTGDLASGVAMATMGGATQHMINFTREHEIEADNIGMKILYNSSFDPKAMSDIFERMQHLKYDYADDNPKFLLTHPVTVDRIAEAKNRANQYQPKKIAAQNTYDFIHVRTLALTDSNSPTARKNLRTRLQRQKNSLAAQYGYALILYKNLQFTEATKIVTKLLKEHPHEVLLQMLIADLATANKQTENALVILQTAINNKGDYYPLVIQYAQTLIAANHSQTACDFLRAKIRKHQDDANLYRLLARAYAKNNQIADAYQAKAKAYALEGYNRQAIILLQQALKTPKLNATDRAIINARIEQIKEVEKEEKKV